MKTLLLNFVGGVVIFYILSVQNVILFKALSGFSWVPFCSRVLTIFHYVQILWLFFFICLVETYFICGLKRNWFWTGPERTIDENRATLKGGITEQRNGGITERRKITPNPKRWNCGITERRKIPPNPKRRNRGITEGRKIPPNPKRQNDGKSLKILKEGITENQAKF